MVFGLLGSYGIFARLRSEGIQIIGHWYTPRAENDAGFFRRDPVKAREQEARYVNRWELLDFHLMRSQDFVSTL